MAVVDFLESIFLSKLCSNTSIPMHTDNTPPLLPYFLFQPLKFSEIKAHDLSNKETIHFSVLTVILYFLCRYSPPILLQKNPTSIFTLSFTPRQD